MMRLHVDKKAARRTRWSLSHSRAKPLSRVGRRLSVQAIQSPIFQHPQFERLEAEGAAARTEVTQVGEAIGRKKPFKQDGAPPG